MRRRDRHARAARPDSDRRRRPSGGFRVWSRTSFERVVRDALAELAEPVARAVEGVPVDCTDVPDASHTTNPVVTLAVEGQRVRRLVIHRRPAEQRAADRLDLTDVVRAAIEVEVADRLGLDPGAWED